MLTLDIMNANQQCVCMGLIASQDHTIGCNHLRLHRLLRNATTRRHAPLLKSKSSFYTCNSVLGNTRLYLHTDLRKRVRGGGEGARLQVMAMQFHPEKSGTLGLKLFEAFLTGESAGDGAQPAGSADTGGPGAWIPV